MATLAAGSGYDARSLPFAAPAGSWSAGQWGQYPSCYPSDGLQDTLATQQDLNNGMYLTGFQTSLSAQALGQVPPRRKCGRPKAPNPLDDPNIPEKKARRQVSTSAQSSTTAMLIYHQNCAEVAGNQHMLPYASPGSAAFCVPWPICQRVDVSQTCNLLCIPCLLWAGALVHACFV
jgi:hypothetical protein